jgi:hypothetical protein
MCDELFSKCTNSKAFCIFQLKALGELESFEAETELWLTGILKFPHWIKATRKFK